MRRQGPFYLVTRIIGKTMKVAYVVSMFPCWSETFILNELISHHKSGTDLSIFSIKNCSENMVHDEAILFVGNTVYGKEYLNIKLFFLHLLLILGNPLIYIGILKKLLLLKATLPLVKIKALAVFWLSPTFVIAAKQKKIEHLHAHFATYPALLAWIIGKFTRIPFTFTAHAHDIYVNQDLLPIVCEGAVAIITISEFNKNFIVQKVGADFEEKIHVIRCGIDLDKFQYESERTKAARENSKVNILSIGRLSGIKGFTYLIDSLKLLKDEGVFFDCSIIGDGPLKVSLLQQVKEKGLDEVVHFLGSKKADVIPTYLKQADVFVLACATDKIEGHDGIPVVFMEAMAYGTPVIGTFISGIPELIIDGKTGFCAKPEDADSLARTIKKFIESGGRKEISGAARNLIEDEYDIEKNSCKLRSLFKNQKENKCVCL